MKKENFIGYLIIFSLVVLTLILMFFGGFKFFIISFAFFVLGGLFELIIMKKFMGKAHKKISKRDNLSRKIFNGFLWVHGIVFFIKRYGLTIYNFKRLGYFVSFISYFTMFLYILITLILFSLTENYFSFVFYLVPIISNIFMFFKKA